MSCNGCRVLRKGCSDGCVLRPSLQWIDGAEAQGNATVFVAKFFGRAGLLNFLTNVSEQQRPALFRSLLYEACGRTINPVGGAVGLLWANNWELCQVAVDTVLHGGKLRTISSDGPETEKENLFGFSPARKRAAAVEEQETITAAFRPPPQKQLKHAELKCELDLGLCPKSTAKLTAEIEQEEEIRRRRRRPGTPNSEESTTTSAESLPVALAMVQRVPTLLNLFV